MPFRAESRRKVPKLFNFFLFFSGRMSYFYGVNRGTGYFLLFEFKKYTGSAIAPCQKNSGCRMKSEFFVV